MDIEKLRDLDVKKAALKDKPYKLFDGLGLYIEVQPKGSKRWYLKYRFAGKENRLSLGVYPEVTLKAARQAALEARQLLATGTDPAELRRQDKLTRFNFRMMSSLLNSGIRR